MPSVKNPFSSGDSDPYDESNVMTGGARALVNTMQRQDARDPLADQTNQLTQRKTQIGQAHAAAKQIRDKFLSGEGADLFEKDPITGKPMMGPDKKYVPRLGAEVDSLRAKSGEKVGLLRGAFTSAVAGDQTDEAKAASQKLAETEPIYKAKLDKFNRIQDQLTRIQTAHDDNEMQLGQLAATRLQQSGVMDFPGQSPADQPARPDNPQPQRPNSGGTMTRNGQTFKATDQGPVPYSDMNGDGVRAPTQPISPPVTTSSVAERGTNKPEDVGSSPISSAGGGSIATGPTPNQLLKIHRQIKDAEMIIGRDTSTPKLKEAMTQRRDRLAEQFGSGMAGLNPAFQKRVVDATRDPTAWEYVKNFTGRVGEGIGSTVTDTGESIARNMVKGQSDTGIATPGGGFIPYSPETQAAVKQGKVEQQKTIAELASAMRDEASGWGLKGAPAEVAKQLNDSFSSSVGQGIGSTIGFIGPTSIVGGVGKLAGLSDAAITKLMTATVAATGAASESNNFRREAETHLKPLVDAGQMTQEEMDRSLGIAEVFGAATGSTEAFTGVSRMAKRIGEGAVGKSFLRKLFDVAGKDGASGAAKWLRGPGAKAAVDVASEMIEESAQEFGQGAAENLYASLTFDKGREILPSASEAANSAAVSTLIVSGLTQALGLPKSTRRYKELGNAVNKGAEARRGDQGGDQAGQTAPVSPTPPTGQPAAAKDQSAVDEFNTSLGKTTQNGVPVDAELQAELDAQTPADEQPASKKTLPATNPEATVTDQTGTVTAPSLDATPKLAQGPDSGASTAANSGSGEETAVPVASDGNPFGAPWYQQTLKDGRRLSDEEQGRFEKELAAYKSAKNSVSTPESLAGDKINKEWTAFSPESKSLGIPRADMPQVDAEHRGAMTNFLKARGIKTTEEEILPGELKPTQAEYSQAKVDKARKFIGGDRAILVSEDGHVLDGHHQWMAKLTDAPDKPIRVIRLGANVQDALNAMKEFPSAETSNGATKFVKKPAMDSETPDGFKIPASPLSQPAPAATVKPAGADKTKSQTKPAPAGEQFKLSRELSGAKPRYSYGSKQFTLKFESDLDKASYILAQDKRSARDTDFLKEVVSHTGLTESEIRATGAKVRAAIKALAKDSEPGELSIPAFQPEQPKSEPVPTSGNPKPNSQAKEAPAEKQSAQKETPASAPVPVGQIPPINSPEAAKEEKQFAIPKPAAKSEPYSDLIERAKKIGMKVPTDVRAALKQGNAKVAGQLLKRVISQEQSVSKPAAPKVELKPPQTFKDTRTDLLEKIDAAIEKASSEDDFYQQAQIDAAKNPALKSHNAEARSEKDAWVDRRARELASDSKGRGASTVTIESGNSKFTVPNTKEVLGRLRKQVEKKIAPPTDPSAESGGGASQVQAKIHYKGATTEFEKRHWLDMMSATSIKELGLDDKYVRISPGVTLTKEAADALKTLKTNKDAKIDVQASTGAESGIDQTSPKAFTFTEVPPHEIPENRARVVKDFEYADNAERRKDGSPSTKYTPVRISGINSGIRANISELYDRTLSSGPTPSPRQAQAQAERFVREIEEALGKRIIFIRSSQDAEWSAITSKNRANTILVNADADAPIHALIGHEIGHQIGSQNPELYKKLESVIDELAGQPTDRYVARKKAEGYATENVKSEWISDVFGQRFDEPEFWKETSDIADKQGKSSSFRNLTRAAFEWINKFWKRLTVLNRDVDAHMMKDIDGLRKSLARILNEYVNQMPEGGYAENPTLKTASDAELTKTLSTGAETSQSATNEPGYGHSKEIDAVISANLGKETRRDSAAPIPDFLWEEFANKRLKPGPTRTNLAQTNYQKDISKRVTHGDRSAYGQFISFVWPRNTGYMNSPHSWASAAKDALLLDLKDIAKDVGWNHGVRGGIWYADTPLGQVSFHYGRSDLRVLRAMLIEPQYSGKWTERLNETGLVLHRLFSENAPKKSANITEAEGWPVPSSAEDIDLSPLETDTPLISQGRFGQESSSPERSVAVANKEGTKHADSRNSKLYIQASGHSETKEEPSPRKTNEPVKGRPGFFYRLTPDSEIAAGHKVVRQIYERRGRKPDIEIADGIIETVGEERASELALNTDYNGIPPVVKMAVVNQVMTAKSKRMVNSETKPSERARLQREIQALSTTRAPIATEYGQATSMLAEINKGSAVGAIDQYIKQTNAEQEAALGGKEAGKEVEGLANDLNKINEDAIDKATAELQAKLRETPLGKPAWERYRKWIAGKVFDMFDSLSDTDTSEQPPLEKEVARRILDEVKGRINEVMPEGEKKKVDERKPSEILRDAVMNKEKFAEAFDTIRKKLVEEYGEGSPIVDTADMLISDMGVRPYTKRLLDKVIADAHEHMIMSAKDIAKLHWTKANRINRSLADALVQEAGFRPSDAAMVDADLFKRMTELTSEAKKKALADWAKRSRTVRGAKKIVSLLEKAVQLNNYGAMDSAGMLDVVAKELKLPRVTPEQMQHIAELGNKIETASNESERAKHQIELMRTMKIYRGIRALDVATSIWYANMLSGVTTLLGANPIGNMTMGTLNLASLMVTNPKHGAEGLRGWISGFGEGWGQARSIWSQGHGSREIDEAVNAKIGSAGDTLELVDYNRDFPSLPKVVADGAQAHAAVMKRVGRFMKATDALFYYPAREAYARVVTAKLLESQYDGKELYKRVREMLGVAPDQFVKAKKQAESEGFKGLDLSLRVSAIIEEGRQKTEAGKQAFQESSEFGKKTTYNNEPEGWAGVLYQHIVPLVESVRPGGVPVLRAFLPFLRVPTNVFNASLNYTPIGAARAYIGSRPTSSATDQKTGRHTVSRQNFTPQERKMMAAQSIAGSLAMAGLSALALGAGGDDDKNEDFDLTASGPKDFKKRQQLEATGWKPYSVRVGDAWISYKDSPLLVPLAIAGHVVDAVRFQKQTDEMALGSKITDAVLSSPQVIFETSMLSGLATMMNFASGSSSSNQIQGLLARTAASTVVPNALQQIDRIFDSTVYEPSGPLGAAGAALPFVRRTGDAKTDVLGDTVTRNPLARFAGAETNDPLREVLREKNVFISVPSRSTKIGTEPMDEDTYRDFVRISGERIKARLEPMATAFQRMTAEQVEGYVDKITHAEREVSKSIVRSRVKPATSVFNPFQ